MENNGFKANPDNPFQPEPQIIPPNKYVATFKKEYESIKAQHPEIADYDSALILTNTGSMIKATQYCLILYKSKAETEVKFDLDSNGWNPQNQYGYLPCDGMQLNNIASKGYAYITIQCDFNKKAYEFNYSTLIPFQYQQAFESNVINMVGMVQCKYSTIQPINKEKKKYPYFLPAIGRAEGVLGWVIYSQILPLIPKLKREYNSKNVTFPNGAKYFLKATNISSGKEQAWIFAGIRTYTDDREFIISGRKGWGNIYVKDEEGCWYQKAESFNEVTIKPSEWKELISNNKDIYTFLAKIDGAFKDTKPFFNGFPISWKENFESFECPYWIMSGDPQQERDITLFDMNQSKGDVSVTGVQFKMKPTDTKWQLYNVVSQSYGNQSKDVVTNHRGIYELAKSKGWKNFTYATKCIKDNAGKIEGDNFNEDFKDPSDKDSSLSGPIKDLLDKHKMTFYLLGKQQGEPLHKLYLFKLGNVQGVPNYTHIEKAICYKQVNCSWVLESENANFRFSKAIDDIDTNFYLLTMDTLPKPTPNIGVITQRKANEFLLKKFPTCSINRPEGGKDPNDSLKPDFGAGGSGGQGGIGGSGQGGFFPEFNTPLPNPDVPPCGNVDGGSQAPVSEIYLINAPELTPRYDDTYDFPSPQAQHDFFIRKSNSIALTKYSYLRKDSAIQIGNHVDSIKCYNYLMYKNKAGKWYYCFIMDKQYINERTTRIIISTDVIQTYLFDYVVGPCYVERCHVDRWKADGKTPTDEFEPEGLEFGENVQVSYDTLSYKFKDTYLAVCSNPLGEIPSRTALKKAEEKGVDENGLS